jgi:hypothetical protein
MHWHSDVTITKNLTICSLAYAKSCYVYLITLLYKRMMLLKQIHEIEPRFLPQ